MPSYCVSTCSWPVVQSKADQIWLKSRMARLKRWPFALSHIQKAESLLSSKNNSHTETKTVEFLFDDYEIGNTWSVLLGHEECWGRWCHQLLSISWLSESLVTFKRVGETIFIMWQACIGSPLISHAVYSCPGCSGFAVITLGLSDLVLYIYSISQPYLSDGVLSGLRCNPTWIPNMMLDFIKENSAKTEHFPQGINFICWKISCVACVSA